MLRDVEGLRYEMWGNGVAGRNAIAKDVVGCLVRMGVIFMGFLSGVDGRGAVKIRKCREV